MPKEERRFMKSRWLSTFTLIGLLLLVLGLVGLIMQHTGSGFVFDPGQPPPNDGQDRTPWYYLTIGALMVLNGLVTPTPTPEETKPVRRTGRANPSASASRPRPSAGREAIATSADKTSE
jgi:hypothetical protein